MVDIYSKQANNECATSLFGPDGYCGFGKCIFDSETTSHCECFKGYKNDFSFTRHPNCYLPDHAVEAITIIALIFASMSFLFNLYNLKQTIASALHLTLSCLLLSCSTLVLYIIYIAQGHVLRTPSLLTLWVMVSASVSSLNLATLSLVAPIYAALHKPITSFKNMQTVYYLIARVALLIPIIAACYYDNQPSSAINNLKFSYALESFVCILGVDATIAFLSVAYNARKMTLFINDVSLKQGSNANPERMERFKTKVRMLQSSAGFGIIPLAIILVSAPLIQFIAGSIPLVFAMFIVGTMSGSFIAAFLAAYAKKQHKSDYDENNKDRAKSIRPKSIGDRIISNSEINKFVSPSTRVESGVVPITGRIQSINATSSRNIEEAKVSPDR